jgi:hypothetical protein
VVRYVIFAAASFALNVVVYLTAWLIAIIPAIVKAKKLPGWLSLLHSHDDDLYGSKTTKEPIPSGVFDRWKRITWWLMRNPGYGFDAYVLGFAATQVLSIQTSGVSIEKGFHDRFILSNMSERWGYRRDLHWAFGFYIKMQFGWYFRERAGYHMLKFEFHPLKRAK